MKFSDTMTLQSCVTDLSGTKWHRRSHLIQALGISPRTFDRHLKAGDIELQRRGKTKLYTLRHDWKTCATFAPSEPKTPSKRHPNRDAKPSDHDANNAAELLRLRHLVTRQQQLIDQQQAALQQAEALLDLYRQRV